MIFAIFAAGCGRKEAPVKKEEPKAESADASAKDEVKHKVLSFDLEGLTDKGAKKWDVKGQSAEAISENEVKLDSIVARAFGEEAEATITADKGIYDKTKNNVKLEQNVKATIENTRAFAADLVEDVNNKSGSLKSKEGTPGKKTRTVIVCDGEALFDYENNKAYFNKNVKVNSDDGDIDADKITVNIDPTTKKVKEIVAEGNVNIKRGENITYSDKAVYVESEKKIVLTGQPKLVIYREGGAEENIFGK